MSITGDIREGARTRLVAGCGIAAERVYKTRKIPAQGASAGDDFPFLAVYVPSDDLSEATGGAATVYQTTALLQVDAWATGDDADAAADAADALSDLAVDALLTDAGWTSEFERVERVARKRDATETPLPVACTSMVFTLRYKTQPGAGAELAEFTGADIDLDIRDADGPDGEVEVTVQTEAP